MSETFRRFDIGTLSVDIDPTRDDSRIDAIVEWLAENLGYEDVADMARFVGGDLRLKRAEIATILEACEDIGLIEKGEAS